MKTTKFIYSSLAAFALMAASCSNDDAVTPDVTATPSSSEVSFLAEVVSRATDTAFDAADKISVYAWDGTTIAASGNGATYTCQSNGTFTATSPVTYATEDQKLSFMAIYPVTSGASTKKFDFSIVADQSAGYTTSDLMVATVAETNTSKPTLSFSHLLSKVVVNVESEDPDVVLSSDNLTVTLSSSSKVSVDYTSGDASVSTSGTTTVSMSTPEEGYNILGIATGEFTSSAVVSPQTTLSIVVKVGELTYPTLYFAPSIGIVSGVEYELDLTLDNGKVELSSAIRNWATGDDLGDVTIF